MTVIKDFTCHNTRDIQYKQDTISIPAYKRNIVALFRETVVTVQKQQRFRF